MTEQPKTYDLTCLGELLIDFVQESSEELTANYAANAGGAPGNVACAASRFGLKSAFIGAVGQDAFGRLLIRALDQFEVDTGGIQVLDEAMTTMAFVSLDEGGDRSFSFVRHQTADTQLELTPEHRDQLRLTACLHLGTLSLTDEPARTASYEAVHLVKDQGGIISFDPNVRVNLWHDLDQLRSSYKTVLSSASILKISAEDLEVLEPGLEMDSLEDYLDGLLKSTKLKLIIFTKGKAGSAAYWIQEGKLVLAEAPTDNTRNTIDTTGAGDIFTGSFLSRLLTRIKSEDGQPIVGLTHYLETRSPQDLEEMLLFGNRVASLATEKLGGITSIPSPDEFRMVY